MTCRFPMHVTAGQWIFSRLDDVPITGLSQYDRPWSFMNEKRVTTRGYCTTEKGSSLFNGLKWQSRSCTWSWFRVLDLFDELLSFSTTTRDIRIGLLVITSVIWNQENYNWIIMKILRRTWYSMKYISADVKSRVTVKCSSPKRKQERRREFKMHTPRSIIRLT